MQTGLGSASDLDLVGTLKKGWLLFNFQSFAFLPLRGCEVNPFMSSTFVAALEVLACICVFVHLLLYSGSRNYPLAGEQAAVVYYFWLRAFQFQKDVNKIRENSEKSNKSNSGAGGTNL